MKINTIELYKNIDLLSKTIVNFEENETALYNKIFELEDIWHDGYTMSFFLKINDEKRNVDSLIDNLNQLCNTFNYCYNNTSNIGKKIEVDFNKISKVSTTNNEIDQYFSNIISSYSNLDLRHCSEVAGRINTQKSKFIKTQSNYKSYVDNFYKVIKLLENMENEICNRIKNISLLNLEIIDFNHLTINDVKDNKMVGMKNNYDIEKLLRIISTYITSENDFFATFEKIFESLRNSYISDKNSKLLYNKQQDFKVIFKSIKTNHESMIAFINNLKEEYMDLVQNTTKSVKNEVEGL